MVFFIAPCEELDHVAVGEGFATLLRPSLWEASQTEQNSRRFEKTILTMVFFIAPCEELDHVRDIAPRGFISSTCSCCTNCS